VIERILPPTVAVAETRDDVIEIELAPEERAAMGRPVEKRRREFTTGRACAREALAKLGISPAPPIASGDKGQPLWPRGVVGSITHCRGFRAAAVARTTDIASLGIDAEEHAPLPDGVLEAVSSPRERAALPKTPGAHLDRLLFSAKEAIYKAWFPLTGRWLGFEDVHLTIDPSSQTFNADLLVAPPQLNGQPLTALTGRWLTEGDLVAAACVVHHATPAAKTF
jgi:4'-phosphopantetheinyl transferase EntD